VQDVNHYRDDAAALLQRFAFVPQARLDDLMLSWASDGGGVGPHVDSYDVFLIQVRGKRRWQIAEGGPREIAAGVPIKQLARFEPEAEWLLEPGDMLYLPAGVAHDGVAVGDCMTASVGFRVPTAAEVQSALLLFLSEQTLEVSALRDRATRWRVDDSGAVPHELAATLATAVRRFKAALPSADECIGRILTLPKPGVTFSPSQPLDELEFCRRAANGVVLDRKSRLLHHHGWCYLNGTRLAATNPPFAQLAHARYVTNLSRNDAKLLYDGYLDGHLHLEQNDA
jgi:50S ribosomal protein L16 3-hydroxylase